MHVFHQYSLAQRPSLPLVARCLLLMLLLGICAPLQGLGLALMGIGVLRTGQWQGWYRFTPLLCGLYPFLVLIPAFAITGGPNFWAIAGAQMPFVLLGLA